MLGNNIAQIAVMAGQLHKCAPHIVFCGGWVGDNDAVWRHITFGTKFWGQGKVQAYFVASDRDRYYGALGALQHARAGI